MTKRKVRNQKSCEETKVELKEVENDGGKKNKNKVLAIAVAATFLIGGPVGISACINYDNSEDEEDEEDDGYYGGSSSYHGSFWHSSSSGTSSKSSIKSSSSGKSSSSYSGSKGGSSSS